MCKVFYGGLVVLLVVWYLDKIVLLVILGGVLMVWIFMLIGIGFG